MARLRRVPQMLLEGAGAIVQERTGLVFGGARASVLHDALTEAFGRSGCASHATYLDALASDSALVDDLIPRITVGETYFFRDWGQIHLLRDWMLAREGEPAARPLRLWSAGCSTGEEAYSLAMQVREWGCGAEVVGTDISHQALRAARRASYGRWALRCTPPLLAERYFEPVQKRFRLERGLRDVVRFQHLNLAEPRGWLGIGDLDLILCRNVLLYFDRKTAEQVTRRLIDRLAPGGWLILGASDPVPAELPACHAVRTESGFLYRRRVPGATPRDPSGEALPGRLPPPSPAPAHATAPPSRARRAPFRASSSTELRSRASSGPSGPSPRTSSAGRPPPAVAATRSGPLEEVLHLYRMKRYRDAVAVAEQHLQLQQDDVAVWVLLVRAHANEGRLQEAEEACARALEEHPMCAELVYLQAVLRSTVGDDRGAVLAYRRALYLDRDLAMAHLGLGHTLMRGGERDAARRALAAAETLLSAMETDELVHAADGETAGTLLALSRQGEASARA